MGAGCNLRTTGANCDRRPEMPCDQRVMGYSGLLPAPARSQFRRGSDILVNVSPGGVYAMLTPRNALILRRRRMFSTFRRRPLTALATAALALAFVPLSAQQAAERVDLDAIYKIKAE